MRGLLLPLLLACALAPASAQDLQEFSTQGLRGSAGIVVRIRHPAAWKRVTSDDVRAVAELRGPQGRLTGILQIGRGRQRADMEGACAPERASTMLQNLSGPESDTRVTDVFARVLQGRPAFELRYERQHPPEFLAVRSLIVCLKDTQLVVSCGATAKLRPLLSEIEPVCREVLDSLSVIEE